MTLPRLPLLWVLAGGLVSACSQATPPASTHAVAAAVTRAPAATQDDSSAPIVAERPPAALPMITVHKSPTCDCCSRWVTHLKDAGFPVTVVNTPDLNPIKVAVGVPAGMGSCHTAQVDGYFIEGHVPAQDIQRLLTERPAARGLAVPGMPVGSPGMEVPSGQVQPYAVHLVGPDGRTTEFSHHGH